MSIKTISIFLLLLLSNLSRAADVVLDYGTSFTFTPGVLNINYNGSAIGGGLGIGGFTIRVFLQNASSTYYVGLFHHEVSSTCLVGGPSYAVPPAGPLDYDFFSLTGAPPCAASQTASFTVPSCIPNGTYNVKLEVYAHPIFFVGTGYTGSFALAFNGIIYPTPPVTYLFPYGDAAAPYGILGSSSIGTYTVTGGGAYSVTQTVAPATCSSYASALLNISSGTAPYTIYLLRGTTTTTYSSATSSYTHVFTTPGDYTFIIRDAAGCSYYLIGTINSPVQPTLTVTPISQLVCKNRCLTFAASVSSGTGYSYSWNQSYPPSFSSVVSTSSSFCKIPASTSSTSNTPNTFVCTVTNSFGCSATASTIITVLPNCTNVVGACCLGPRRIAEHDSSEVLSELMIYPNPGSDQITIILPPLSETGNTLDVIGADGKVVKQIYVTSDMTSLDVSISDLASGIYVLSLRDESIVLSQTRFIKE